MCISTYASTFENRFYKRMRMRPCLCSFSSPSLCSWLQNGRWNKHSKLKHNMNMGMDADTDTDIDTDKDADTDRDIDVVRICPCPCMCPSLYPCCVRVYVWILPCLFPWAAFDAYFTTAKCLPSMLKLLHCTAMFNLTRVFSYEKINR
jgi:hypothetical protein